MNERCMHNEMCKDFDEVRPESKYGFCKGFPLVMVEKYRQVLDIGRISGVHIIKDLSTGFNYLLHDIQWNL